MKKIKRNPNRWILVRERLPEEGKWYVVLYTDGYITTDLFSKALGIFSSRNIIAWLELPTPPIKGEFEF